MSAPEKIWTSVGHYWEDPTFKRDKTEYTRSDLIPTAAYVAGLEAALRGCLTAIDHADMKDGVCCCGDDMLHHESPMNCGHNPRDSGEYHAAMVVAMAEKALSARHDAPDVRVVTVACPAPVTKALEDGQTYWVADPITPTLALQRQWSGYDSDKLALSRGLIYTTEAGATARAKAMIGEDVE